MTPLHWLEHKVYGFSELDEHEREAIYAFTMLWSFFEAQMLSFSATPGAIRRLVESRLGSGSWVADDFSPYLDYFCDRYFPGNEEMPHFSQLRLRERDEPAVVEAVLRRANFNSVDRLVTLFLVIYRLRNNLFHGYKWEYGLRDQKENFDAASQALMVALTRG